MSISLTPARIFEWLREEEASRLNMLWELADGARRRYVGDDVHLRGLAEISNHCVRRCTYCGINTGNNDLPRYRMDAAEILGCAREARALSYGTVVLQSGEDRGLSQSFVSEVVRAIKGETGLAVTLSLGERPEEDFGEWKRAGADRYLLRFETSDRLLYERVHPSLRGKRSDRFSLLRILKKLGYEIGSGVMVGLPGQTFESLARDIESFRDLDLDMIGVGPFIPHPTTALGRKPTATGLDDVPATELMTLKVVALARLVCPEANIPATTALSTVNMREGYELALQRGANVVMPNITPAKYRALYQIYPGKSLAGGNHEDSCALIRGRIEALGRGIGTGPGGRRRIKPVDRLMS